jgi:hypothetical protein
MKNLAQDHNRVNHILFQITPMHTGKTDGTSNMDDNDESLTGDTSITVVMS